MRHFRNMALGGLALVLLHGRAEAVEPFPAECRLTLAATVPISLTDNHVNVPVMVNGRRRTFAIDTGAFTSAVSKSVVAEQGIKTYGIHKNLELQDSGHKDAELYATLEEFVIGNQKAHDARMSVMEPAPVDGLVGPEYLRNFDLDFDFAAGTLNLFRHHPCSGRAVYWTDDYFVVPMDVTDQGHIRVDVLLDGKPIRAMLDTGAAFTVIGKSIAQSDFNVDMDKVNVEGGRTFTLSGMNGGEQSAVPHRFMGLQLGGINIKNPILAISTAERGVQFDYTRLVLGMPELSKLHLYVAYDERKLYFSRANANASDPARIQR
ncbi:MAG TPA: retropepsin-like aspartic protease [Rhizomicrobium sp.]|nr:retropepsin-like aspartic protease [Rhizomicrobium sp.]